MKEKNNSEKTDRYDRLWDRFDVLTAKSKTTKQLEDLETMLKVKSLQGKITDSFIDYCNTNNIDLIKWYRWQLHLIWEQRNIYRKTTNQPNK